MGCHDNIRHDKFPKQGRHAGKRVNVCFHYDTTKTLLGAVVRDDAESPGELIIRLDDGRFVRSVECMYSPLPEDS